MLDTIFIGMSGLTGYAKGLRVIGNNLTNVNTPGFKGSTMQFADLFYQGGNGGQPGLGGSGISLGTGLNTLSTALNFKAGELKTTGQDLDLAVNGDGMFVLHDGDKSHYTRAGNFEFDKNGFLVSKDSQLHVSGLDDNGKLLDITLEGLRHNAPKVTSSIQLTGRLSTDTTTTDFELPGVNIFDPAGGAHVVKLSFKNNTGGDWTVTVLDDTGATIGTGDIQFDGVGKPIPASSKFSISYTPTGMTAFPVEFDFSGKDVEASSGVSSLAVDKQDGYGPGDLSKVSFDDQGFLVATYSNGQTSKGTRLALATFSSTQDLVQLGGNQFDATNSQGVHLGYAKTQTFGSISSGTLEGSNVDMAEEFSNLIVMQRGYQAASHVVSTANDMIQELFDMKGHR